MMLFARDMSRGHFPVRLEGILIFACGSLLLCLCRRVIRCRRILRILEDEFQAEVFMCSFRQFFATVVRFTRELGVT